MLLYINCLMTLGVFFTKLPTPKLTYPSDLYYKTKKR